MQEPKKAAAIVVAIAPKPGALAATIRRIAEKSDDVGFGDHALERMEERGITRLDVLRVLRTGDIKGEIEAGRSKGEWKCKMTRQLKGQREIGVVTVVIRNQRLYLKTVEWEDT